MRKLIGTFALLTACHSTPAPVLSPVPTSGATIGGAADPAGAVRTYLAAVKAEDLQALSLLWGTKDGPVRSAMDRTELEKREIIVVKCLAHDSYDLIGDAPGLGGKRVFAVSLKRRDLTRTTNFNVVPGVSGRWYVEAVDMEPLKEFCNSR